MYQNVGGYWQAYSAGHCRQWSRTGASARAAIDLTTVLVEQDLDVEIARSVARKLSAMT